MFGLVFIFGLLFPDLAVVPRLNPHTLDFRTTSTLLRSFPHNPSLTKKVTTSLINHSRPSPLALTPLIHPTLGGSLPIYGANLHLLISSDENYPGTWEQSGLVIFRAGRMTI